jgi:hypothetical protein
MPLDRSGTKQAFSNNVKREMEAGRPQAQAVAISYAAEGQRKPKKKGFERFHQVKEYIRKKR